MNEKWEGLGYKVEALRDYLQHKPTEDIILFIGEW